MKLEKFTQLLFATLAIKKNPYEINGSPFIPGNFLDIMDDFMKKPEIKNSLGSIIDLEYYEYNHDSFQNELTGYMNGFMASNKARFDFTYNYITYEINKDRVLDILNQYSDSEKQIVSNFTDLIIEEVLNVQTEKQLKYANNKDLQYVLKKFKK